MADFDESKLNLGCGYRHFSGWLNVDKSECCQPDMQVNLEEFPWPFDDNSVTDVRMFGALEHMGQDKETFCRIMQELYRVCRHGAHVHIIAAYPRHENYLSDPTAVRPVTMGTMRYFDRLINKVWRDNNVSNTPLAEELQVDFRLVSFKLNLDENFTKMAQERKWDNNTLRRNIELYNNAIASTDIHVVAVKDQHDTDRFALAAPLRIAPYMMYIHNDLNSDREISGSIATTGQWHPTESTVFSKVIFEFAKGKPSVKVLNAGASLGWYALLASQCGDNISVTCYEPLPENLRLLRKNVALHNLEKRVQVKACALSDTAGKVKLYTDKHNLSLSELRPYKDNLSEQEVECSTLDNEFKMLQTADLPQVVMLDVQGCEQKVFDGARESFRRGWRPLLFTEVFPSQLQNFGSKAEFVLSLIKDYKYTVYAISSNALNMSLLTAEQIQQFVKDMQKPKNKSSFMSVMCVPEGLDIKSLV